MTAQAKTIFKGSCHALVCVSLPLAALLASASKGQAQEEGGLLLTFGISQTVESREERGFTGVDRSGLRTQTAFDFGLRTDTRSQSLVFDLSTGLAAGVSDDDEIGFERTNATLTYTRDSRDAGISFDARYRRDEIDTLVFDGSIANSDVISGIRERGVLTVNSGLVLGRTAPVTGTFGYTYEASRFFDTVDPALTDTNTQELDAVVSFRLSRVLEADIFANLSEIDAQEATATDRETALIGTRARYAIDPATTVTAEIAYSEEESRGITVSRTEGSNYGLSVLHERPNGELTLDYSQREVLTGTRRQLTAGQTLTLAGGALGYTLGVAETDGFDPQPLASLSFEYETDRRSIASISFAQEADINGDDEEVVNSRLSMSYTRDLTALSQIGASLDLVDENVLDAASADQRLLRVGLIYQHDLTADWAVTSGYAYTRIQQDGVVDRTRSSVFVGLRKSFAYRP